MKLFKNFICILLAASMLLFVSCKKNDNINKVTVSPDDLVVDENGKEIEINGKSVFMLSYTKSDSLNPFLAVSVNNQLLASLLYEPLFKLDENFAAQPIIADSFEYKDNTIAVKLKKDVKFSDGSSVSAADVIYSFNSAKKSPAFSANLSTFVSADASDSKVIFTMAENNIYSVQNLTFPIVKNESIADDKTQWGIGSGKFVMLIDGADYKLKPNKKYLQLPVFTNIKLVNVETRISLDNALKIGNISFAYKDLSEGIMTGVNAKTKKVPLNNMVYLGFNGVGNVMKNLNIRKAVSFSIDRDEIAASAYHGFAKRALSVYNPSWEVSNDAIISSEKADAKAARTALDLSGYTSQSLRLIVNDNNSFRMAAADLIAKQLQQQNINVTVEKLPYEMYLSYIENGWYDMYIGEVRLTNDMSLSPFFTNTGNCRYGIDLDNSKAIKSYAQFVAGEGELGKFILDFQEEMPFVPIVYRSGLVQYTNQMKVKPTSHYGDIFENIAQWTY